MLFGNQKEIYQDMRINIFEFAGVCKKYDWENGTEIGGVMYGKSRDKKVYIEHFSLIDNVFSYEAGDKSRERYKASETHLKSLRTYFGSLVVSGNRFLGEFHSHPSGNPLPSSEDIENIYTNKLKKENYILGIITAKTASDRDLKNLQVKLFDENNAKTKEYIYTINFYCFNKNYASYKEIGVWSYNTAAERLFKQSQEFSGIQFVKRLKRST